MRFTRSRSLAAISAAIAALACVAAQAAAPRYGGTLHVKLRASSVSLDPHEWTPGSLSSAASEKRDTMANVLLQREAQPADSLLPQWLSGYAFLFESSMNLQRARELRAAFPAGVPGATQPLRLRVDAPGDLFKLIGERVAVNARQANLLVQVALPGNAGNSPTAASGLHLFAWHYDSLSPHAELEVFVKQLLDSADLPANSADPDHLFAEERRLLEERRILPLVLLPEYAGVRANVHNWNASPWGDWRLADVWLDSEDAVTTKAPTSPQKNSSTARNPGARP